MENLVIWLLFFYYPPQSISPLPQVDDPYLDTKRAVLVVQGILDTLNKKRLLVTEQHSHYKQQISITREMTSLWNTYRQNIHKVGTIYGILLS